MVSAAPTLHPPGHASVREHRLSKRCPPGPPEFSRRPRSPPSTAPSSFGGGKIKRFVSPTSPQREESPNRHARNMLEPSKTHKTAYMNLERQFCHQTKIPSFFVQIGKKKKKISILVLISPMILKIHHRHPAELSPAPSRDWFPSLLVNCTSFICFLEVKKQKCFSLTILISDPTLLPGPPGFSSLPHAVPRQMGWLAGLPFSQTPG